MCCSREKKKKNLLYTIAYYVHVAQSKIDSRVNYKSIISIFLKKKLQKYMLQNIAQVMPG